LNRLLKGTVSENPVHTEGIDSYFYFMKILLDIKDNQGLHLIELLKSIPYVRTTIITDAIAFALKEVREAVIELKEVLDDRKESRNADDFLNEL